MRERERERAPANVCKVVMRDAGGEKERGPREDAKQRRRARGVHVKGSLVLPEVE